MRQALLLLLCCILSYAPMSASSVEKGTSVEAITAPQPTLWSQVCVAILGDSNTWLGADDCSRPRGWTSWLVQLLKPAACRSYARSGATWTNSARTVRNLEQDTGRIADDNVIYNQAARLISAVASGTAPIPQLILISAGTNDAWFPADRPHAFDPADFSALSLAEMGEHDALSAYPPDTLPVYPQTIVGSVRYNCLLLHKHFPKARIVLLTPLQTTAVSLARIRQTADSICLAARNLSIDVIRQERICCVKRNEELQHHRHTYDGTHTNELGARLNARILSSELMRLTGWK